MYTERSRMKRFSISVALVPVLVGFSVHCQNSAVLGTLDAGTPADPAEALRVATLIGSCTQGVRVAAALNDIYMDESRIKPSRQAYVRCLATKSNGCRALDECRAGDAGTSEGTTPSCTPANRAGSCVDGKAVTCGSAQNCPAFGLGCTVHERTGLDPTAFCVGTGPACATNEYYDIHYDQGIRCEGNTLVTCMNGTETEVDCASFARGFTCYGGSTPHCGLGAACEPGSFLRPTQSPTTCEGTSLVVCNAGRIDRVDCRALGFTSCAEVASGVARCVP